MWLEPPKHLRTVVDYVCKNPGATQRQIRVAPGLRSKAHVEKCLGVASAAGLIEKRTLPKRGYHATDEPQRHDLLTVRQVATALGYSDEHVYRFARRGRIQALRIGNDVRVTLKNSNR